MELIHQIPHDGLHDADGGGEAGEEEHDEEDGGEDHAEVHLGEDGGQGDENQRGAHAGLNIESKSGGEDDQAKQNSGHRISDNNHDRTAADGLFPIQIGAVNNQIAAANTQRKERLANGRHDRLGVQAGEVGQKVESQALVSTGKHDRPDGQENDKDKHQGQQDIAHFLNTALYAAQNDYRRDQQHNAEPENHLERICGKLAEHDVDLIHRHPVVGSGEGFQQIRQGPAGNSAVERQGKREGKDAQNPDEIPLLPGKELFQGGGVTGSGFAPDGILGNQYGKARTQSELDKAHIKTLSTLQQQSEKVIKAKDDEIKALNNDLATLSKSRSDLVRKLDSYKNRERTLAQCKDDRNRMAELAVGLDDFAQRLVLRTRSMIDSQN